MSPMRLVRRPELRALTIAALAAALALAALGLTLVFRTNQGEQYRRQTEANCLAIERLKATIRGTFHDARARAFSNPDLSPAVRTAVLAHYDRELARYAARACPHT